MTKSLPRNLYAIFIWWSKGTTKARNVISTRKQWTMMLINRAIDYSFWRYTIIFGSTFSDIVCVYIKLWGDYIQPNKICMFINIDIVVDVHSTVDLNTIHPLCGKIKEIDTIETGAIYVGQEWKIGKRM